MHYCYFYSHLLCGYGTLVRIDTKAHCGLPSGALAILQRRQVPLHTKLTVKMINFYSVSFWKVCTRVTERVLRFKRRPFHCNKLTRNERY